MAGHADSRLAGHSEERVMALIDLKESARELPHAWSSRVVATVGIESAGGAGGRAANVKIVRMDGAPYPEEQHDYAEGLLVVDGHMNLVVKGEAVTVRTGELYVVPPGVVHHVAPGSAGTLLILDV
jgi:mannose-6-phosphate isomerase-like protein (cupin superfamily)